MSRQKKVALFISHIFGEYQKNLCNGIIYKATEYGYSVDIFVSNDGEAFGDLGLGEDGICAIPNYRDYRGVIIAAGTYVVEELRNQIIQTVKEKCSCPIVNIYHEEDELYSIEIDNSIPMKEMMEHLISVHHYKRICFLAYKNQEYFSAQRLISYKEILEKYHLSYEEQNICWTYDNDSSVRKAIEYLIHSNDKIPDAIVCYNDSIALLAAKVINDLGYKIPSDIAITGYDNLEFGKHNNPSITTVQFPVFEMGVKAMEQIYQVQNKISVESKTIIPTHPIIRASCGCSFENNPLDNNYYLKLLDLISTRENNSILDMNMAGSFNNITDIDDGMDLLETFVRNIESLEGLYLCLYNSWDSLSNKIKEVTNYEEQIDSEDDIVHLKFAIKNKKRLPECSFHNNILLPEYIYRNSSSAFLYMPLYFKEKKFGYLCVSYQQNHISYDFSFMSWLRNINNMLQRICSKNELNTLVDKLEELYLKDETTNFYNRKGLQKQIDSKFQTIGSKYDTIAITSFLLCDYTDIQRNHGYFESTFAIKVLAKALESSLKSNTICARMKEDVFMVAAFDYEEQEITLFIDRIHKYLENYNTLYPKGYTISAKSNFSIFQTSMKDSVDKMNEIIHQLSN